MSGRRRFIAALGVAPLVPAALAQTAPAPPHPSPAPSPSASPMPDPTVDALTALVEKRYGTFIEPGESKDVRAAIEWNVSAAQRLRKHRLSNADEPATTFEALPPAPRLPGLPKGRKR